MSQITGKRSKEGIKDPRVKHCYDRGNSFLVEDVPRPRSNHPNGGTQEGKSWKDLMTTIKSELWRSLQNPIWGGFHDRFVPRRKLYDIMTPGRIRDIITGLLPNAHPDLESFTHAALRGGSLGRKEMRPSVRLLAALVYCGNPDIYMSLVEEGVSDYCLPPAYRNNDITQPLVCQSKNCGKEHAFLGNISDMEREEFHLWAYRLNAPYFKKPKRNTSAGGRHNHYILGMNDVLPIISSVEQKPSAPRNPTRPTPGPAPPDAQGTFDGGYSTVTRVEFHPDHYDFGSHVSDSSVPLILVDRWLNIELRMAKIRSSSR